MSRIVWMWIYSIQISSTKSKAKTKLWLAYAYSYMCKSMTNIGFWLYSKSEHTETKPAQKYLLYKACCHVLNPGNKESTTKRIRLAPLWLPGLYEGRKEKYKVCKFLLWISIKCSFNHLEESAPWSDLSQRHHQEL